MCAFCKGLPPKKSPSEIPGAQVCCGGSHPHDMSSNQNPSWLGYIGDYIAQSYMDYNKPLEYKDAH